MRSTSGNVRVSITCLSTNVVVLKRSAIAKRSFGLPGGQVSTLSQAIVCADDARVWQPLCTSTWSAFTNPDRWLHTITSSSNHTTSSSSGLCPWAPKATDNEDEDEQQALTTYRSVFVALRRLQLLMGLWKGAGDSPYGSLYRIGWASAGEPHIEVVALKATKGGGEDFDGDDVAAAVATHLSVVEGVWARVGVAFPDISLKLVDESIAVLKEHPWKRAAQGAAACGASGSTGGGGSNGGWPGGNGQNRLIRPSAAALAAAAVATGGRDEGELLGASPPRSFGYEVLRFMEAHVAGSRSGSRKSRHPAACHQAVVLKHLVRLQVPTATRQRPLAGLWMGVYGPHGPEIISLGYDGRGSGSMIVATKITGDPNVPAGEVTFRVDPEPLSQPWPLGEVELITNR
ncbi:hypothetical protein Vafri_3176, partial [Volvox africanus]